MRGVIVQVGDRWWRIDGSDRHLAPSPWDLDKDIRDEVEMLEAYRWALSLSTRYTAKGIKAVIAASEARLTALRAERTLYDMSKTPLLASLNYGHLGHPEIAS